MFLYLDFLFPKYCFVTCIFLLVLFWQYFWCLYHPLITNLHSASKEGGRRTPERKPPRNSDRNSDKGCLRIPQSATVLKGSRFIWQEESIWVDSILHFPARQMVIQQCFHHITLQLKTLCRFHCVSAWDSWLASLFQQHICRLLCALLLLATQTCQLGSAPSISPLFTSVLYVARKPFPYPSCLTRPFLPLDFIHNYFILEYF